MDKSLVGIVIDPGHGGSDSGALGNNLKEKDYNLMISKYMYDRFKELGIPVALTRDSDKTLAPNERTNLVLDAFGNNPNVVVVSNHLNAGGGEFTYHYIICLGIRILKFKKCIKNNAKTYF